MGNFLSSVPSESNDSNFNNNVASESGIMEDVTCLHEESSTEEQFHDSISDDEETRTKIKEQEMNEFRKQLNIKREQRKEILARHRAEKKDLENALYNEKTSKIHLYESNRLLRELLIKNNIDIPEELQRSDEQSFIVDSISSMREEIDKLKSNNHSLRCDLASSNSALQEAYTDIAQLSAQNTESIKQVNALKEVISVSKTMINLREEQLNELKNKLNEIEQSLADRETSMLSTDLRHEYERQLQNIRNLRGLYEERARLAEVTRQALSRELEEHKILLQAENNRCKELNDKIENLETKVNALEEDVEDKIGIISTSQEETRVLKAEMMVVNKLFSQVLLGYKNKQDLDKLVHRLEENHGLLTQMAGRENGSEVSSELPKLLLEIVTQIDENIEGLDDTSGLQNEVNSSVDAQTIPSTTPEEIVQNLPKVWRVLMELLSHQSEPEPNVTEKVTTCYKSVETKSGPVLVPSVSQTYIRLKDLILEKLTLIKEVNRMKQLNTHLESRLGEQERRLCMVTNELSKTWHVVGRLRRHHHQLHTHEKILKYELQQKRKLLNELKEELEYCREKWKQAREKNTQSEKDWRKLRTEFSNRKLKTDLTASAESGYSDERPSEDSSESNDEDEYKTELKVKCRKKVKKSFETIIDSSTDFNLAAEREDPVSDMLDVAELPLDTQDDNFEVCDASDSCNSRSLPKSEQLCDETEDEITDLNNEMTLGEITDVERPASSNNENISYCSNPSNLPAPINPAMIIKSTKEQNERLALKDKRLEKLENSSIDLLKKTQGIVKTSNQINYTLDNILNRPTSSRQVNFEGNERNEYNNNQNNKKDLKNTNDKINPQMDSPNNAKIIVENDNTESCSSSINPEVEGPISTIDFSAILESVKRQDERLQLKDERLQNLEQGCSAVLTSLSNTLNSGEELSSKLDFIHRESNNDTEAQVIDSVPNEKEVLDDRSRSDSEEPSSSKEINHEARFAARDLRLKRLEEQTKSLVNKVNKTTTKGVKIHYKLEELHNIYGSEHSRSGTPSEDTEDISQNDDDTNNE